MKAIIIEDEKQSADFLELLLQKHHSGIDALVKLRSVEESLEWFRANADPDLIFIDIELSDGTCFEILEQVNPTSKLIFTTAYDQHALKAFKYNSIAYLLKPITTEKLQEALIKLESENSNKKNEVIINELKSILQPTYKKRFLVKRGESFLHIPVDDIAYFISEDGLTRAYLFDGKKHFIDHTLEDLECLINPVEFFRINRKIILNINAITTVKTYFSRRLLLELEPKAGTEILVSKDRVAKFKTWLDS